MASEAFFFLILLLSVIALSDAAGSLGINYGRIADNLPSPDKVLELLKSQGLTNVKIYDTDANVLRALANSGINVVVALPNELLQSAATDQSFSDNWVQSNISPFYPATKIEAIAVGNEVFSDSKDKRNYLVQAMKNIHASLVKFKMDSNIKISSPIPFDSIKESWPPSAGSFNPDLLPVIEPMLEFLEQTGSDLMVNIYPYFAYINNPDKISLDYALCNDNPGVVDPNTGLTYDCLFDAQLDAVNAAIMSSLKRKGPNPIGTESGWPSGNLNGPHRKTMRNLNEIGASTIANAAAYNGNLVRRVFSGKGTPLRPDDPVKVYLFALFNEDKKPGPAYERNFGLFYPDMQKVYDIPLTEEAVRREGSKTSVSQTWCVAKANVDQKKLQEALDYACGEGGADCNPIQPGAPCYDPNTLEAHASYAFNSYYQKNKRQGGTCDFSGVAHLVSEPPSFVNCEGSKAPAGQTWCVANVNAGDKKLQEALDYACGQGGADCGPIQPGAPCYNPNTLEAHASYAFNSYYQKNKRGAGTCVFDGAARMVSEPPSFVNCEGSKQSAGQTWCVANVNAGEKKLQASLDYACGQGGADCGPIQPGAPCYDPNTLEAHASYAFNSYYQKNKRGAGTCVFDGAARVVSEPPSFVNCESRSKTSTGQTWCVANVNAGEKNLQASLDYACGQGGADCGPIQPGAPCYDPNTLEAHASYAFNSYYQKNKRGTGTCVFDGAARVVSEPPRYGNCEFPTGY